MEYLLSFLLLSLNLIDYEHHINQFIFLFLGAALFTGLFYIVQKKTSNFMCSCIVMLCHTWPYSWINILGTDSVVFQLTWFYFIGVIIIIYAITRIKDIIHNENNAVILLTFCSFLLIFIYPLIISVSKSEGLKEFIMIGFFIAVCFISFLLSDDIPNEKRGFIADSYIWSSFISCVFIIIQTVAYHSFGTILFKYDVGMYLGHVQTSASLLMEDASCATIMLGSSVFYVLDKIKKANWKVYVPILLIIVAALAMTTRRTSVVSLIIILAFYCLLHYKGMIKKTAMIVIFLCLAGIMIFYLLMVRPVDNLSEYLYENGRFNNYIQCFKIFIKHPFGIGYDNVYLVTQMVDKFVPHNTFLRWLVMGGLWFVVPMLIILIYIVIKAYKKKLNSEFWALIYSLFACNFIPDIISARFFIIPCTAALLIAHKAPDKSDEIKSLDY